MNFVKICVWNGIDLNSLFAALYTEYVQGLLMKAVDVKLTMHNFYLKGKQNLEENTFKLMYLKEWISFLLSVFIDFGSRPSTNYSSQKKNQL